MPIYVRFLVSGPPSAQQKGPGLDVRIIRSLFCHFLSHFSIKYSKSNLNLNEIDAINYVIYRGSINPYRFRFDKRQCIHLYSINKAVARGGGGATGACEPPFSKKKKKNLHLVKKYNMNKQNFNLTFLGKLIY